MGNDYQRQFFIFKSMDNDLGNPTGYIKVEVNGELVRFQISLNNLADRIGLKYQLYGIAKGDTGLSYTTICDVPNVNGRADIKINCQRSNVGVGGLEFDKINIFSIIASVSDRSTLFICPLVAYKNAEMQWKKEFVESIREAAKPQKLQKAVVEEIERQALVTKAEVLQPDVKTECDEKELTESGNGSGPIREVGGTGGVWKIEFAPESSFAEQQAQSGNTQPSERKELSPDNRATPHNEDTELVDEETVNLIDEITKDDPGEDEGQNNSEDTAGNEDKREEPLENNLVSKGQTIYIVKDLGEKQASEKAELGMDLSEKNEKSISDRFNFREAEQGTPSTVTSKFEAALTSIYKQNEQEQDNFNQNDILGSVERNFKDISALNIDRDKVKKELDIDNLSEELDKSFEGCNPFKTKSKRFKWWKINSPGYLNNILFRNNVRTYLLFNPQVMLAHYKYRYIVFGIRYDKYSGRERLVCGVPGVYSIDENPFGNMGSWAQLEGYRPKYGAFGYWMILIDPRTGKLIKIK